MLVYKPMCHIGFTLMATDKQPCVQIIVHAVAQCIPVNLRLSALHCLVLLIRPQQQRVNNFLSSLRFQSRHTAERRDDVEKRRGDVKLKKTWGCTPCRYLCSFGSLTKPRICSRKLPIMSPTPRLKFWATAFMSSLRPCFFV